jgi:hypothetical protein
MGVELDLGPVGAAACLDAAGITFMFAPRFHPAFKAVVPVRRALKVRTAFNILGPMLNVAGAKYGLVGVWSPDLALVMAEALQVPFLFHGCDLLRRRCHCVLPPCGSACVAEFASRHVNTRLCVVGATSGNHAHQVMNTGQASRAYCVSWY